MIRDTKGEGTSRPFISILERGPATTTPTPSCSGYPPWILKRVGLESTGWRLISSIGKTKRIAFFFGKKKYAQNVQIFLKWFFKDFLTFFCRFLDFLTFSIFLGFLWVFWVFWDIFWDFLRFVGFFLDFLDFWIFWIYLDFFGFFLDFYFLFLPTRPSGGGRGEDFFLFAQKPLGGGGGRG